jgi:protoheme IX farnesyltransferase
VLSLRIDQPAAGPWLRLTALAAAAGTALAVVSGAAGFGVVHRLLAALALPPLAAVAAAAWVEHRRLLAPAAVALLLFGGAAALVTPGLHLAVAAAAFAACAALTGLACRGETVPLGSWRDYVALTKPRIMTLLLLTGGCGFVVGAHGRPGAGRFGLSMLGLALACGGASALNHYLDRDIDPLMGERTKARPVAAGRVAPSYALEFGLALSAASFTLLAATVNLLAALLALAGNLFYVLVYTRYLKRRTVQNIVIGGAAGAVPPLVGYAAGSGNLTVTALLLFAIVFVWTPPHFWALALLLKEQYAAAEVPMLPVVRGDRETIRQILWYTALLVAVTLVPVALGEFGLVYALGALALGGWFGRLALRLRAQPSRRNAAVLFHYSLLYLALLFVLMALDLAV